MALIFQPLHLLQASERLALVIGISNYENLQTLRNPVNDANDIAEKLKRLDFELFENKVHLDLTESTLIQTVNRFANASFRKEIAFLFFAGHGMQFNGAPHLLPADVPFADMDTVQNDSVSLENILRRLDGKADLAVTVFDACREIPEYDTAIKRSAFSGGVASSRGLSRPNFNARATLVAYSGAAGELVSDGVGRNSPYSEALLRNLDTETQRANGFDIPATFLQTAFEFQQKNNNQSPELIAKGIQPDRFYFLTDKNNPPRSDKQPKTTPTPMAIAADAPPSAEPPQGNWCQRNKALCVLGGIVAVGGVAALAGGGGSGGDPDESPSSGSVTLSIPVP